MQGLQIILPVAGFIIGGVVSYYFYKMALRKKYENTIKEAENNKKAELEKEVTARNQKIQQAENRIKQKEATLNQRQDELQKRKAETEALRSTLETQMKNLDKKHEELEKLQLEEITKLESISGLSAEEAKERLIDSLKAEAKTQAASYINDIMDDAKLTATREAKRIVIQSIQRVATETAIENSVTVFHIDSDEIKGRIIGREGRNIRALEAATGVEIIVDDTPEAIVLSPAGGRRPYPSRPHRGSRGQSQEAT